MLLLAVKGGLNCVIKHDLQIKDLARMLLKPWVLERVELCLVFIEAYKHG